MTGEKFSLQMLKWGSSPTRANTEGYFPAKDNSDKGKDQSQSLFQMDGSDWGQ